MPSVELMSQKPSFLGIVFLWFGEAEEGEQEIGRD